MDNNERELSPKETDDSLIQGCMMGCMIQILCLVLAIAGFLSVHSAMLGKILLCSWGFTQWIAIIPLVLKQRAEGRTGEVNGLLITGCIGLLLSSGCATATAGLYL